MIKQNKDRKKLLKRVGQWSVSQSDIILTFHVSKRVIAGLGVVGIMVKTELLFQRWASESFAFEKNS